MGSLARTVRRTLAASVTLIAALAFASSAHADQCFTGELGDADGFTWERGSADTSIMSTGATSIVGSLIYNGGGGYFPDDNLACGTEDGGREFTWPPDSDAGVAGLSVTRKLYVPPDAPAFARFLDILTNTGGSEVSLNIQFFNTSLQPVFFRGTSSGDLAVTSTDDWVVSAGTDDPLPPNNAGVMGQIWDSAANPPFGVSLLGDSSGGGVWESGDGSSAYHYNGVTLAPGQTLTFMHLIVMRPGTPEGLASALTDTPALSLAPAIVYEGMSAEEIATLQNWIPPDPDGDGRVTAEDNCPDAANPGQEDNDGDGAGDACDADDDNDGVPDATEATLGSNPTAADSDGDGRPDGADACLTQAAATGNGCPAPAGAAAVEDNDPAGLALAQGGRRMSRRAFLRNGVSTEATCDEPCSLEATLFGTVRGGRITARRFNLVLGTRSLGFGAGTRTLSVRPDRRLVRRARRFTVRLRVVATDRGGNKTTRSRRIRVRR